LWRGVCSVKFDRHRRRTFRVDTIEPVARRTDTLLLLLESSKALAYSMMFLATLAFVAKL